MSPLVVGDNSTSATVRLSDRPTLQERHPRHAPPLFPPGGRAEAGDEVPEPGEAHRALEPQRLLPHRAPLHLPPAQRLEEARAFRRGEQEGGAALRERLAPAL